MPYFLAPLVTVLVLSAMLYKTKAVWNKHEYDLTASGWDMNVAEDFVQMKAAVDRGIVDSGHADTIMKAKWQGPRGGQKISQEQADALAQQAVHHKAQTGQHASRQKSELR